MSRLLSYMLFDGDCALAMNFYQKLFAGRIETLTTVGESPMASQFPPASAHRVIHASLSFDGNTLMASDWMAPEPYPGIKGTRFTLTYQSVEEANRVFSELSAAGRVQMPMQKTSWAQGFGMLVDRFGVPWQIMAQ
ncbi:MAG TPA: VOC family protein [Steroidobacteraceae bacterium]|jgi:PhnB protein